MKITVIGAMWCPACLKMKKIWKEIEAKELDIDFDSDAENYNVGGTLPVIIFEKNNKEVKRLIGEFTKEEIEKTIEELD